MKFNISTKLAFIIALLVALFIFVVSSVLFNTSTLKLALFSLSGLLFTFCIIKFLFENYIEQHFNRVFNIIYGDNQAPEKKESLAQYVQDARNWKREQQIDIDNLQKQNDYKKEFIGNLSHELKTPLFSIQGYVETLLDGGIDDPNINKAYLRKAVNNIERLSAIVKDVDTIAKVESDALNLNKISFNILDLINEVNESLELIADKNDVELYIHPESKSLKVNADKDSIRTVLVNLISNSIKYGKEGGKTTIKTDVLMSKVLVEISDNGIGIKKEQLPRVFERFYRVDSNRSRQQGGSGLGLAIVKHIIEAHQQKITVKSEYGSGSSFSFTLNKA